MSDYKRMDTIFALSSGALPSGIAVVRLSGPQVKNVLTRLSGDVPKPRYMNFCTLRSAAGDILDQALTAYFPAPKSFTGEDCAEFYLHGGKAVVARFLEEIAMMPGCRLAEPGEFARRAFAEGKLDLTEAEGMADLIAAETESQRRLAIMGASGALAALYQDWRKRLVKARALIEAEIDFADEDDVPGAISEQIWADIAGLKDDIFQHVLDGQRAAVMRDGLKIVIAGAPNAGKSSVINRLAGREVAIVTEEAGTTRDVLEVRLVLGGLPVLVTDTAGLRPAENRIEKMGIEVAVSRIEEADLVLLLDDMHDSRKVTLPQTSATVWPVGNKLDLGVGDAGRWPIQFSVKTGKGWDDFMERLNSFCQEKVVAISAIAPARRRHSVLLKQGLAELELALDKASSDLEIRAEHLRLASDYIGRITGDIDVEYLLDVIFSEFCIGK